MHAALLDPSKIKWVRLGTCFKETHNLAERKDMTNRHVNGFISLVSWVLCEWQETKPRAELGCWPAHSPHHQSGPQIIQWGSQNCSLPPYKHNEGNVLSISDCKMFRKGKHVLPESSLQICTSFERGIRNKPVHMAHPHSKLTLHFKAIPSYNLP